MTSDDAKGLQPGDRVSLRTEEAIGSNAATTGTVISVTLYMACIDWEDGRLTNTGFQRQDVWGCITKMGKDAQP